MTTISTIFSGGEGVGAGARMAGLVHILGIEHEDKIAQVTRNNNFDTITADVLTIDPHHLRVPDILHASPVCTNASVANANAGEAQLDIDAAKKTAEFIEVMKPQGFTLENVYPYRNFESFRIICDALRQNGYSYDYWHINAANYGVPQTRKRLILIAKRDGGNNRIQPPIPTHRDPNGFDDNQMTLFAPTAKPWIGWYEAIKDLIPFLPDSQFAKWQLERLPVEIKDSLITRPTKYNPAEERGNGYYFSSQPAPTVLKSNSVQRAFVNPGYWDCGNCSYKWQSKNKPVSCPHCSNDDIGWNTNERSAGNFMVDGDGNRNRPPTVMNQQKPSMTIQAWHGRRPIQNPRAFLSHTQAHSGTLGRYSDCPSTSIAASKNPDRGFINGRVVKMTPRALARFQSFPDWYRLPDNNTLACKVIGNAVPPLLYSKIAEVLR